MQKYTTKKHIRSSFVAKRDGRRIDDIGMPVYRYWATFAECYAAI